MVTYDTNYISTKLPNYQFAGNTLTKTSTDGTDYLSSSTSFPNTHFLSTFVIGLTGVLFKNNQ